MVTSHDGVRRSNLSAVLRLVHLRGALSRAEITSATGLNRSTTAALIAQLEDLDLVEQTDPAPTRRVGRPSPVVMPTQSQVVLAVNPEVDAVTVGVVGLGAQVLARRRHRVDHVLTPQETVTLVATTLDALAHGPLRHHTVRGVGVAVPGLVHSPSGVVHLAPHLGWSDVAFAEQLSNQLKLPVTLGNDATLGAIAEHRFGAGRGLRDLVYLNGGASGIGGGVIAADDAIGGTDGYAGEFGHTRPGIEDDRDRRSTGVLEDEVNRARLLEALGADDLDECELHAALVSALPDTARHELDRQRRVLAVAIGNAINVLNPEAVILGGFLAGLHASAPGELHAQVARHSMAAPYRGVRLLEAGLAEDRLLVGAAEIALEPTLADPAADTLAGPSPSRADLSV